MLIFHYIIYKYIANNKALYYNIEKDKKEEIKMEFSWDNVKSKIFSASESAGKYAKIAFDKTTNMVDVTKLNLAKSDTENKMSKLYAKMGEKIYTEYLNGTEFDGEFGEIMQELDKYKEELDGIKEKLLTIKSASVCPECGERNPKENEYCSACGAKLTADDAEAENDDENTADATVDVLETEE